MTHRSVRFLNLSDTHDNAFPDPATLPHGDVVIHCGDLTMVGGLSNYRRALESLASCPAEVKLVIAGNHDVSLDTKWWSDNLESDDEADEPSRAHALLTSDEYISRGVRFLNEGIHEIILCDHRRFTVYASQFTPTFGGYAFGYNSKDNRFNTKGKTSWIPDDKQVDIVITHGPPRPPSPALQAYRLDLDGQRNHLGCPRLWEAIERVKPKMHCFGHIHEGHGSQSARIGTNNMGSVAFDDVKIVDKENALYVERLEGTTLLLNASIMRHGEEGNNKPWVVDMVL